MANMLPIPTGPGELRDALGRRLRDQRLAQNLTQAALAVRSGVPLSTLKRLEQTGHGSMDAFVRVVFALELEGELEALFPVRLPTTLKALLNPPIPRRRGRRQ